MAQTATTPSDDDLTISDAVDEYLSDKSIEAKEGTVQSHQYRLSQFIEWCDEIGIQYLSDLHPTHFREFRKWRHDDGLAKITLKTHMDTLRVFIRWCETYGYVDEGMSEAVVSPSLDKGDGVDLEAIEIPRAQRIKDYLRKYEYATREHVVFELIWHTTMRNCTVRSLDVADFNREKQTLTIRNRSDEGTRLKKGEDSERDMNLNDDVAQIMADWIDDKRPDVTDEYGREPLIAWESGRPPTQSIAKDVYWVTTPSYIGEECSCDDCEATCANNAYQCEDSMSPKRVRKASITHHLNQGWPDQVVADRADNSVDIIREHYDTAGPDEKAARRRKFMDALEDNDE